MEISSNCVICQMSMKRKFLIRLNPCKHMLHEECSVQILEAGSCPICRVDIIGSEVVERKAYKKYSVQDRQRIVEVAERGDDWAALASSLNINYKTAFSWVNSGRTEGAQRGGNKPRVLTEEEIDEIIRWIEDESGVTLSSIKNKILRNFNKSVCLATVSNYLVGRLFTLKTIHKQPIGMNSIDNKRKRCEYVEALSELVRGGKQVIYIDETNFNLFCRRHRGRSRVGARAIQVLPTARGRNVHLIGAIAMSGIISLDIRRGSFKAVDAQEWLRSVLQRWLELGNRLSELVVVCDNAPCHARLESAISEFPHNESATLLRLGPYSPMLNPIENIWSKIKTYVKTRIGIPPTVGSGVTEQRMQYLETLINEAKATVTGGDCGRAIQHSTSFYADALAMVDMSVGQ